MVDLLRVESNERIDLGDFQYLANEVLVNAIRDQGRGFLTNPNGTVKTWILGGFGMTNPTGKQLTVTRGRALLGYRVGGITNYGMLTIDGDATKTIDMTALTPATYNVYVRFEYIDTTSASRVFWDPAGTGQEFAQTVPTRLQANWSLRVETTSPGTEWTLIGTANNSGGSLALVDKRTLYFEGDPSASPTYRSGWGLEGGGVLDDRNANRGVYGVSDLQTFTAAMRQCLEDLKGRGLRRWWENSIGGMNIGFATNPVENRLCIGDTAYNKSFNAGTPTELYDSTDYVEYSRANNHWGWWLSNVEEVRLGTGGIAIRNGLMVGFLPTHPAVPADDAVQVGDENFSMQWASNPQMYWDTLDYITYNRTSNYWDWFIASTLEARLSDAGLAIANGLYVGSASTTPTDNEIRAEGIVMANALSGYPYMSGAGSTTSVFNGDANDYMMFDRTNNLWSHFIGSTEESRLSASGLQVNRGLYVGSLLVTPIDNEIQAAGSISSGGRFHATPSGSAPGTPVLGDIYPDSDGNWKSYTQLQGATASWGSIGEVRLAVTTVSNAQFLGMPTTPITVVPAQGANTLIVPVAAILHKQYNGSNTSAGSTVTLTYAAVGTWSTAGPANTPINDGTSDEMFTWLMGNVGGVATGGSSPFNTGLTMSVAGAAFTGGDTTFKVYVWYSVMRVE